MPEPTPNPLGMWNDFVQQSIASWNAATSGAAPGVAPASANQAFELWSKFFQDGTKTWAQAVPAGAPAAPADVMKQFFTTWQESWLKTLSASPSPDVFKTAERLWTEQLDSLSESMSKTMSTEAFSTFMSKMLEQQLSWQSHAADMLNPQIDQALRTMNIPSRDQMNRLFERVLGIEERLSEIEDQNRQILKGVTGISKAAVGAPPAAAAPAAVAASGKGRATSRRRNGRA